MSKKPEGKPKLSFIYTSMLNEIARVREYGNKKYGSLDDWKTTKPIQHYESAERHIRSLMDNEWIDSESGFSHAAHAICNLMFEIERTNFTIKDIPFISESAIINPEIWNKFKKKIRKGKLRKNKDKNIIKTLKHLKEKEEGSIAKEEIAEFNRIRDSINKEEKR